MASWQQAVSAGRRAAAGWLRGDAAPGAETAAAPAVVAALAEDDGGAWTEGRPCASCGRRFTTERAMGFHVGPEGECLDPMTARRPRGGFILSIVATGPGGVPVWGHPRKVLDARG